MPKISKIGWWLSIFSALVAGGPLAVVLFTNPIALDVAAKIAIVTIIVLLSFFLSYFREARAEQQSKKAESFKSLSNFLMPENIKCIMETFLGTVVLDVPESRANIMLIENNNGTDQLIIKYHVGMNNAADLHCFWDMREGCCGIAWAKKATNFMDLSIYSTEEERNKALQETFGIKPQNIACTKDIMSILSVPIFDVTDSNIVIGVINCDSKLDALKSGLQEDRKTIYLNKNGTIISQILNIYSIVKEGKS